MDDLRLYPRRAATLALVLALALLLAACQRGTAPPTVPPTATALARLRIANLSDVPIEGLVVVFPALNETMLSLRVPFGDVPAGEMSDYREIPGGVYRYAAYHYTLEGTTVDQPVTDWMGEVPMAGSAFTYTLSFDPRQRPGYQIRLVEVTVDTP